MMILSHRHATLAWYSHVSHASKAGVVMSTVPHVLPVVSGHLAVVARPDEPVPVQTLDTGVDAGVHGISFLSHGVTGESQEVYPDRFEFTNDGDVWVLGQGPRLLIQSIEVALTDAERPLAVDVTDDAI